MKYAKIINNKVVQVQPYMDDGFVEVPEYVVAGMVQENGSYVVPPISQEQLDAEKTQEAKQYLASTDWYYARKMETGEEVPADVVTKRLEARALINELEEVL